MPAHRDVLLRNCSVLDGFADAPVAAAVLIRGERIHAVGRAADLRAQAGPGCHDVDLGGRVLMPGLINMHTHFSLSLPGPRGDAIRAMNRYELTLHMASGAARTLHAGVTTVRCVGERRHADFALRSAIERGVVPGPRMFTAGRALACTGGHGSDGSETLQCDGADGFRRGVRSQVAAGADLIKLMISGGIAGEHERIDTPQLTGDEMAAAIGTAHDWGRKVTAHAGPPGVIATAVSLGLDCVEHGYQLTAETAHAMARAGTALVPTLIVTRCAEFFDALGVPDWMQQRSLGAGPRHVESFRAALAAGVTVLLGSDMPPFWDIDGTTATVRELEHMVQAGLSPAGAVRSATSDPAAWLGAGADIGSVQPGRYADLIALDDDPTVDIAALRHIRWVMKGGVVVRDDGGAPRARSAEAAR